MTATRPSVVSLDAFRVARKPKAHSASPSFGASAIGATRGVPLVMTVSSLVACVAGGDPSLSLVAPTSPRSAGCSPHSRSQPVSRRIAHCEHHDLRDAARPIGSLGPGQTRANRAVGTSVERCKAAALERDELEADSCRPMPPLLSVS